jgi:hypothetical protein
VVVVTVITNGSVVAPEVGTVPAIEICGFVKAVTADAGTAIASRATLKSAAATLSLLDK